ncbi:hypothetical protein [Arthrobacter sp. fls2-241-R2A-172]|uniref:hypothetical protein n=1 Tax=Arthrobacter sp. fls2-241-R2A-172 TaxID=3040325 RepID=UPI00254F5A4C|nr:hypothetical protein [Arthrobacter sp. fls2-241-R2A-172]
MTEDQVFYTFQALKRVDDNELSARPIRQLSEEEFGQTWNAIDLIENYLTGFDAYIWRAVEDLFNTTEEARNQYAEKGGILSPGPIVSELELRIINVCSTVKMYAEHVEVRLGRLYGKESPELREVSRLFSALYDSSLPYRVSNHLRNALVHGSPAELLVATFNSQRSDSGESIATVEVHLSREGFQKHAQNAKVRDEVVALPEELELLSTVIQAAKGAMALHEEIMHLLSPGAVQAADWLAKLFKEASTVLAEDEWPGFFEVHPEAAGGSKIQPLPLPENVSRFIQDYIDGPISREPGPL